MAELATAGPKPLQTPWWSVTVAVVAPQPAEDRVLVVAIAAALDRVEYQLSLGDPFMADVSGAIVRKLLSHPCARSYASDLEWRRSLVRWEHVRTRLGAPPLMLADFVEHHAAVLLVEASRANHRVGR